MPFTKRTYTKTQKIYIYGGGTILAFLSLIASLYYLGIAVETSGDITCSGTKADPCISYFNITLTNYSLCLGSTFSGIYFNGNATAEIFKADARYSRTNPARWKSFNFTKGTCLAAGKKHEFMVKGYKKSPQDSVKWSLDLQGKNVDPWWYGENGFIIDPERNTINISTDKIYASAAYNITGPGWTYFELKTVNYSGLMQSAWLVNTEAFDFKNPQYYDYRIVNDTNFYSCNPPNSFFNYTANHFWCYLNLSQQGNGTGLKLIYDRNYEWGSIALKTAYWNESRIEEWHEFPEGAFQVVYFADGSIVRNATGMNKGYILNATISSGQFYRIRAMVDIPREKFNVKKVRSKYWWAIKPDAWTWQDTFNNNFYIDPWIDSSGTDKNLNYLDPYLTAYYKLDEASGTVAIDEKTKLMNGTSGSGVTVNSNGAVNKGYRLGGLTAPPVFTIPVNSSPGSFSIMFWINHTAGGDTASERLIQGNSGSAVTMTLESAGHPIAIYGASGATTWYTTWIPPLNTWAQVVYTRDNVTSIERFYINGSELVLNNTDNRTIADTIFNIGARASSNYRPYAGNIDEIAFFNRSLNWTDVMYLYNNGTGVQYNKTAGTPDTEYPEFNAYEDDNASLVGNGTGFFNVSVIKTNGTVFLEVNNTNVTANTFNRTCYQEFANISTACGGLSTGTYVIDGTATNPQNFFDGDWSTYAYEPTNGQSTFFYINYTKPYGSFGATWELMYEKNETGAFIENFTLPERCWGYNPSKLLLRAESTIEGGPNLLNRWTCRNVTGWEVLASSSSGDFNAHYLFEEAVIWNISMYNASYYFNVSGVYPYKWISYGNGTSKNLNVSVTRSYTVNSSDTCTCAGPTANWKINCFDNCTLTKNCDMGKFNISINGTTGHFLIVANITNIDRIYWGNGCTLIKGAAATIW